MIDEIHEERPHVGSEMSFRLFGIWGTLSEAAL